MAFITSVACLCLTSCLHPQPCVLSSEHFAFPFLLITFTAATRCHPPKNFYLAAAASRRHIRALNCCGSSCKHTNIHSLQRKWVMTAGGVKITVRQRLTVYYGYFTGTKHSLRT